MVEKIAHITDLHLDEAYPIENGVPTRKRFDKILEDLKKEQITTIVCTGDIGENDGIAYFFEQLKTTSLAITLGNHDSFTEITRYYNKGADSDAQKLYSSSQKAHYKCIFLDSSEGIIDKKQLIWLKKELITSQSIIIFVHHPIIGLPLKVDEIGALKNRGEVLFLLENIPNDITIFCGHYHMESETVYKNCTQNITPAVSFQIEKKRNSIEINPLAFGYRIIALGKNGPSSQVKMFSDAI